MSKIRGYIILVQFSLTVAVVIILMYAFRKYHHQIRKAWMKIQMKLLGIKLEQVGTIDTSCDMVIMNHQSLLDIVVMEYIHDRNLAWVAKKQIADLFFFGHIIKAPRMISINREDRTGVITLIKEVKDRLSHGRPIAMFPEGTRGDGTKIAKFKSGAKIIADKYKLRVQPVVMLNTRKILDSKTLNATPGTVKVIYLDPIQAEKSTDWLKETEVKMREVLEKELEKESQK